MAENWRRVHRRLPEAGARVVGGPDAYAWLWQEHGAGVREAHWSPTGSPDVAGAPGDAIVTDTPHRGIVVLVADCAPVALAAAGGVAVVHAGWRGLAAGVVEEAVAALGRIARAPVRALVGPCICPRHYEFGAAELEVLADRLGHEVVAETEAGRPAFDLPAAVTSALERAGVDDRRVMGVCTATSPDHFSHRREGETGRQAMLVVQS